MPYEGRDRSAGAESADPVDARVTIEESPFGVEAGGEAGAIPFIESGDERAERVNELCRPAIGD